MRVGWAVVAVLATAVSAVPWSSLPLRLKRDQQGANEADACRSLPDFHVFHDMFAALRDMQHVYFQRWIGTWPDGIDWTRAVMATHVAALLRTLSEELELAQPTEAGHATSTEHVISGYFADLIAYYFGQDAFAIRNQAYDDMLWVVLGWLESIQFVDRYTELLSSVSYPELAAAPETETWYGNAWVPAFAHRARVFWELAAKGWDTQLCGGGMVWNPRLMPYKNAITNQLFISASIGMYLHFPGDLNTSPFVAALHSDSPNHLRVSLYRDWRAHDPVFGTSAQEAHRWLASSNMTNAQGLYADGFHISGYNSGGNNTRCDERDEMVYTYNQGVILSGLLGLFRATGRERYLAEGHMLVRNVIRATGYDLARDRPVDDDHPRSSKPGMIQRLPAWRGLGRAGVLEDACDVAGACSQDAQTFKGIWMHHFAGFCAPPAAAGRWWVDPAAGLDDAAVEAIRARHAAACRGYLGWLRHNAAAALGTRDERGLFGMWWTAGLLNVTAADLGRLPAGALPAPDPAAVDYRNGGVPADSVWVRLPSGGDGSQADDDDAPSPRGRFDGDGQDQRVLAAGRRSTSTSRGSKRGAEFSGKADVGDPNLRGRGRTVETQGGGLALLRALWVVSGHEL